MKRVGQVFVVLGVLGGLVAVALGVVSVVGASRAVGTIEAGQEVGSGITRELHAGDEHLLTTRLGQGSPVSCTVEGPDGREVSTQPTEDQVAIAEDLVGLAGGITVTADGPHTVRCTDPDVHFTDAVSMTTLGVSGLGLLAAVPMGLGAGLALVLGIVLWVVGAGRENRPRHPGGYGGGYGQPVQPSPYGQSAPPPPAHRAPWE